MSSSTQNVIEPRNVDDRHGQVQHPRDMGAAEVQQFLAMLTTQRNVSVSTHNQALSALLFLYREVLGVMLPQSLHMALR